MNSPPWISSLGQLSGVMQNVTRGVTFIVDWLLLRRQVSRE